MQPGVMVKLSEPALQSANADETIFLPVTLLCPLYLNLYLEAQGTASVHSSTDSARAVEFLLHFVFCCTYRFLVPFPLPYLLFVTIYRWTLRHSNLFVK